ncbi:efflux RND transporter permease subunit, partial [Burkholderia sp. Tr-860]|uniref:efflux RND transporter permease subunit n=1 Tax=Burkholderia sp. Tr-860 TaxID=2608338 RepID=UPI001F0416F4
MKNSPQKVTVVGLGAIGGLLAAATVFVFLRNLKITLIAVALVPVVMAATILLLSVAGMGFNIMTLGG